MSCVQLLEPLGPDTPVGRFLERRGEGIHHVGYGVADIAAALAAIGAAGVRLLDPRPRHGSMGASIAFLHPADVGGVLTELVQARCTQVRTSTQVCAGNLHEHREPRNCYGFSGQNSRIRAANIGARPRASANSAANAPQRRSTLPGTGK